MVKGKLKAGCPLALLAASPKGGWRMVEQMGRQMDELANSGKPNRNWVWLILLLWIGTGLVFTFEKWAAIQWFALGDTDDNLRMQQVRDLLHGQGWYDLRQYRLDPPGGANIHWSRLVDLPIAGMILLFRPIFGGLIAEKIAVTVAPMLPLFVAYVAAAVTTRRLIAPAAWPVAIGVLMVSQSMLGMYKPLRIDHHGWQLAMLCVLVAGLVDPKQRRGGLTVAVATVLSLVIGLEMLPYLAVAGGILGLRWVVDGSEAMRLRVYAVMLAGGTAIGYLIFASYANQEPRCDALSPVWLSVMLAAGGFALLLTMLTTNNWMVRLGVGAVAGALLAAGYVYFWPQCTNQLEGFSPELKKLWFDNVREVKPLFVQNRETIATVGFSALFGILGAVFGLMRARGTERFYPWLSVLILSTVAGGLLLWQSRAGPAAQALSVPGLAAFGWALIPQLRERFRDRVLFRVFATVGAFALISGLGLQLTLSLWPSSEKQPLVKSSNKANAQCSTIPSHRAIAALPKATIFTFADLSPRLIVLTHHSAIAGPYHRNEAALLDIHRTFRGPPQAAEAVVRRHGATLVMICANSSESTLFSHDGPNGFYAQLAAGKTPPWLEPVTLPKDNPFKVWRVKPLR
jgi:hypothetical protein